MRFSPRIDMGGDEDGHGHKRNTYIVMHKDAGSLRVWPDHRWCPALSGPFSKQHSRGRWMGESVKVPPREELHMVTNNIIMWGWRTFERAVSGVLDRTTLARNITNFTYSTHPRLCQCYVPAYPCLLVLSFFLNLFLAIIDTLRS